ncbi:CLUMA_CG010246, isoform A [Clunio marinus]|uniref:CLUMA_CG010246, isoform A n=1 Tax=Clunio marinus TaxID=568069 RepID=A0A1J1ICT7_9DIPT|nr:CLUMA_CG010246, isoform A [Clunio marinus]
MRRALHGSIVHVEHVVILLRLSENGEFTFDKARSKTHLECFYLFPQFTLNEKQTQLIRPSLSPNNNQSPFLLIS